MTATKPAARTREPGRKMLAHAPLVRQTWQDQLYPRVRDALAGGGFFPGETVTIRALADQFETSTMPVREALRRLGLGEDDGHFNFRAGRHERSATWRGP